MTHCQPFDLPARVALARPLRLSLLGGALVWMVVLWALALLMPASVHAQDDEPDTFVAATLPGGSPLAQYVPTAITSRNGLPQNSVRSIAQSSDGYVWLATEEGLVRYDGNRTRVFDRRSDPILRDNFIQSIATAPDGSVWVSTRSGISRYAHGSFVSHAPNAGLTLRLVFCDKAGTVWVGTETGLYTMSPDGLTLVQFAGLDPSTGIWQMAVSNDGSVWVATTSGLWHIEHGKAHRYGTAQGLPETEMKSMDVGGDGSVWVATNDELIHWKDRVINRLSMNLIDPHDRVMALLVDEAGSLWVGLRSAGIVIVQAGNRISHYRASDGLPVDTVKTLYKDRDNNLWVGFNGGGAVRFHAGLFTTYGDREGLAERQVWTARTAHDGSVWTAASHMGLNHVMPDGHIDRISRADGLTDGTLYSMFVDNDNSLWTGSDQGDLTHIVGHRVTVFHNPDHAQDQLRTILRGPDGDLFLLYHTSLGLVRFRDGKFLVEPLNIPGLPVTAASAPDGSLWIATDKGGVTRWNNGVLAMYGPRQGFTSQFPEAIAVDSDGTAWVGSSPDGLARIRGSQVTRYVPENGLYDYTVGSVTDDLHGYLWMTSNKGIYKVRKQELEDVAAGRATSIHSIVYGVPDGMRSAECNYDTTPAASLSPDGRLWFATTEGLVSVLPTSSAARTSRPDAVIEGAVVDGVRSFNEASLQTSIGMHDVEFDFTAPDFAAPERLHFRYKLDGFDRDWNDAGNRNQAFYTRLPPGSYTLLVQAADGSSWPNRSAAMNVVVPPHYWQTLWFRCFALMVMLLCGWGSYEVRTMALRRNQRILQEQVVLRTAELQEAMREAKDAQHELQELATRDSMTRLWNRRHIFTMLSNEANRAERECLSLCVLMLDVDHFKQVNDTRGHLAGDRVLQAVSNVLIEQTRPYDCAGRYGGEEFLVILCNCSLENGMKRADMIRGAIEAASVEWNGAQLGVTASFGVALHVAGNTIEAVLDEADRALYHAKQTGRNRVCSPPPGSTGAQFAMDAATTRDLLERSTERLAVMRMPLLNPV